jgi:hypothetical protein
VENEKSTLYDLEYVENTEKNVEKIDKNHCLTWNMVRNTEKRGK